MDVVGDSDPATYPIQKKATSLEHLRTIAHLRPRTNTFQSVFRVRNAVSWQIHKFFQERGFQWVHTPIITSSDCEGAGEMFTLDTGTPPFFGKPTFLTVSGQLAVRTSRRRSPTCTRSGRRSARSTATRPRHAAEFWMIEPEVAFCRPVGRHGSSARRNS